MQQELEKTESFSIATAKEKKKMQTRGDKHASKNKPTMNDIDSNMQIFTILRNAKLILPHILAYKSITCQEINFKFLVTK